MSFVDGGGRNLRLGGFVGGEVGEVCIMRSIGSEGEGLGGVELGQLNGGGDGVFRLRGLVGGDDGIMSRIGGDDRGDISVGLRSFVIVGGCGGVGNTVIIRFGEGGLVGFRCGDSILNELDGVGVVFVETRAEEDCSCGDVGPREKDAAEHGS